MATFAAFPSTIMEAAFGRLHNGAGAFGVRPIDVESIMVDGKTANIAIQHIPDESPSPMKATFSEKLNKGKDRGWGCVATSLTIVT